MELLDDMEPLTSRQYAVYSALRGPDAKHLEGLKMLLTARIRAMVMRDEDCFGAYEDRPFGADDLAALRHGLARLEQPLKYEEIHYLDHLRLAIDYTYGHPVWGGLAEEVHRLLHAAIWPTEDEVAS
jgi:hypothetical protein